MERSSACLWRRCVAVCSRIKRGKNFIFDVYNGRGEAEAWRCVKMKQGKNFILGYLQ